MAEVIAILSSLTGIPVRQDLAITGSMNQFGVAQPIGGAHLKVEGFHRLCHERGFTGTQGVIIPASNVQNLTLRDNVIDSIQEKNFFIWPVHSVFEALELMLNTPVGVDYGASGAISKDYPFYKFNKGSILRKAEEILIKYHKFSGSAESPRKSVDKNMPSQ
jgi:predicted ATP-dependent protease